MSKLIDQSFISETDVPKWKHAFEQKQYLYLKHVINGLISKGGFDSFFIDYDDKYKTLHIYEPFVTLNCLSFMSPSVVSIKFNKESEIEFLVGNDNGIGILSSQLHLAAKSRIPNNLTAEICFWHFIDNIGEYSADI